MRAAIRNKPASENALPVHMVHLLAKRPELREIFSLAVAVDAYVRENA